MQLLSIKNIFEYQDRKLDGVKENLFKNINQLQGLGVPDICIITKQQPINFIKSSYETSSSFHFVQGLCPQSQGDVFDYLESIVQNQEKERQNVFFSKVQSIAKVNGAYIKVTYLCYDIFSRAFLVCEALFEGQKNKSVFLVQENQRMILPTSQHWKGVYISNVLRAIDEDFKLVGVGRFFNNLCLKNNTKLCKMIESMLELITINANQFQDFEKIRSNQCFCDINDVLYYLCWPLDILVSHLVKSHQLFILVKELDKIQNNVIFHLIKSIIFYKMKQYQKSLSCLGNITQKVQQFNLVKYLLGKVLIKLGKYQQAFQILQDTLTNSYEDKIVWIALASIFRKQNKYQVCLSLLNKAAGIKGMKMRKQIWFEIHFTNYRVMTQDHSISNLNDLDNIYTQINPFEVDQVESFSQLSNHPVLQQFLMRSRGLDKKQLKLWYNYVQKCVNNWNYKIEKQVQDFISQNQLLESKNELTTFQKEIIKLSIQVGHKQLQKYLKLYFFQTPHNSCSSFVTNNDNENFKISLKNTNVKRNFQDFAKKQIIDGSLSLNYIDSDDDDQPEFLQSNLNKSFNFSHPISLTNIPTQNQKNNPKKPQFQKQASSKFSKQTYWVIPENMFESVESQRDISCQFKGVVNRPIQNLNEKKFIQAPIVQIYGLIHHLSENLPLLKQTEIGDSMKRKKDQLNPYLKEFIDYISQTFSILDNLFYNNSKVVNTSQGSQKQQFHSPEKQASKAKLKQIFSSSLKESLKDKHYEEKQIELKEFYTIFGLALNDQDELQTYNQFLKQESIFLFNCSIIAKRLKQYNLAQKLLQKINDRVISIQVSYSLLNLYKDEATQIIQLIQSIMMDFLECGISKIVSIPLWIEIYLVRLIKLKGCNYVLGSLSALEDYDTFQLMKKIVLQTENLL